MMDLDKRFVENHNIQILGINEYFTRKIKSMEFFIDDTDKNVFREKEEIINDPLITISIPQSELIKLQTIDNVITNYNQTKQTVLLRLLLQQEEEEIMRQKYPAIDEAFKQYSLLLNLCKENSP